MTPVIELSGVKKCYGALQAVTGVSLQAREGEILGLLGHNGAGKTTLMKLMLGLAMPSAGTVRVLGQSAVGKHAWSLRRCLGYLPENVAFYGELTGREVLGYFARLKGCDARERDALLDRVGLAPAAGRRVRTYSKGMRQRLGFAQALLGRPRLLFLDEPTVGLDPIATRDFYATLDKLRAQGTTILLSSHALSGIERHVDRVAILDRGRLLATGTMDELRRRSGLPLTIHVRGRLNGAAWHRDPVFQGAAVRRLSETEFEITGPAQDKLALIQSLLRLPGIEDIDSSSPTLESLYAHFAGAPAGAREEAP